MIMAPNANTSIIPSYGSCRKFIIDRPAEFGEQPITNLNIGPQTRPVRTWQHLQWMRGIKRHIIINICGETQP